MSVMVGLLLLAGTPLVQEKIAVPGDAEVKAAEKLVRDIFKDDYGRKSQADRALLAQKLLKQSAEVKDDPPALYVLLRDAHDLATQAGDASTSLSALEKLTSTFQVNALSLRLTTLGVLGRFARTTEAVRESIKAHLDLVDEALRAEDMETAEKACESALAVSKSTKDVPSITRAEAKRREVRELKAGLDRVKTARAVLAASPGDPAANEQVGRHECFVRGDWAAGLPLLAKAASDDLKELAKRDLAESKDPAEQTKLGDAWWELAQKEAEPGKSRLKSRAATWYAQALPSLAGLTKAKVEKRLAEVPAPPTSAVPEGLVGWWRFDEGSGTTAADSSGGKQGAHLMNGVRWVPGRIGMALALDGVDDHGVAGLTRAPAANAPQTLAWFQKISLSEKSHFCAISVCNDPPNNAIQAGNRGRAIVIWRYGGSEYLRYVPASTADWMHLAYTFDGQNHRLYEGGELKVTSATPPAQTAVPRRLDIGRWGGGNGTSPHGYVNGLLDDLRIYNRALSAAEIKALAEAK